jgi:hypothetical protein
LKSSELDPVVPAIFVAAQIAFEQARVKALYFQAFGFARDPQR